ncbi:MAG: hypothetical protein ACE15E_21590 [Acidobacteriota bacterium]
MSPADVLREIRAVYPDLPVTVVTGYPDSTFQFDALPHPSAILLPPLGKIEPVIRTPETIK